MEVTYKDKVYGLFFSMKPEEEFLLLKVAPANKEKFIEIVKEFIHYDNGAHKNFYLEFNNEYTKIRKVEIRDNQLYARIKFRFTDGKTKCSDAIWEDIKTLDKKFDAQVWNRLQQAYKQLS